MSARVSAVLVNAVFAVACASAQVQSASSAPKQVPQGDSWDSIKQLPNWNGVWRNTNAFRHFIRHGSAPYKNIDLPFNEKSAAKFAELKKLNDENKYFPSRNEKCIAMGFPGQMESLVGSIQQILFTPGQVTLIGPQITRKVYTDGRPHAADVLPSYSGDSIGHWERGGVLVVDTVGLDAGNEIIVGMKQGNNVHVVERFHQDGDKLLVDMTITAPEVLATPWTNQLVLMQDKGPLFEYTCSENRTPINPQTGEPEFDISLPPDE